MAHLARPKRAAEDFARTHHEDAGAGVGPAYKKPRFDLRNPSALAPDAPEDDVTLDADVIGPRGQQVRRNAVNIDGYDSDSENEGFDGKAAARSRAREDQSKAEEAGDMFADLEDEFKDGDNSEGDATQQGAGKKKAVRFLEADEIEGQVLNSKSGGHVSANFHASRSANGIARGLEQGHVEVQEVESSSESEVDDETRAATGDKIDDELGAGAKKKHAPKLDAFNMRNEQDEGRFDDQGNFVRKAADPDAVHDSWLEGLSKKDMRKAKEAAEKREEERRRADLEKDSVLTSDALKTLIPLLEKGETVLEALARFGKGREKKKPKWQTKNKNRRKQDSEMRDAELEEEDQAETTRKAAVESITEAADLILSRDHPEIYDAERELLIRLYRRETGEEWVDVLAVQEEEATGRDFRPNMWEYRWSDARDGGEIHGPYEGSMMKQWNDAGYFGVGVEFKRADVPGDWSPVVDFL
jgi:CD2 antigen cytoplasmic tail-binding protein 2